MPRPQLHILADRADGPHYQSPSQTQASALRRDALRPVRIESVARDWLEWHRGYDDPDSPLAARLQIVREFLSTALTRITAEIDNEVRIVSICAGDGRDVLPVLSSHTCPPVRARLIEIDERLAHRAKTLATSLDLNRVEVMVTDAGATDAYVGILPAHIVLAVGVYGNLSAGGARSLVQFLPSIVARGGLVISSTALNREQWMASDIPQWFMSAGFRELATLTDTAATLQVTMHEFSGSWRVEIRPGARIFDFIH